MTLPSRYGAASWWAPFWEAVEPRLHGSVDVLDVGSGKRPTIEPKARPSGCTYTGLDLSRKEMLLAPAGSYDEMVAGDITHYNGELESRFDLAVSWQLLEHVKPLQSALENIRQYLRPGGRFVGQLSATFAPYGLANRAVPHQVSTRIMKRLLARDPATVFPAYYDRCWYSALVKITETWSKVEILPRYVGATYLSFSPPLQRAYLVYENWTISHDHRNLATHYLIVADR